MAAPQQALLSYGVASASNGLLNNLVSYYKLDGNANDSHSTNNGTPANISWVSGKINTAASFNGTNSSINLPSTLGNFGTGDFTFMFRWQPSALSTYMRIINKYRPSPTNNGYDIRTDGSDPTKFYIYTYDGSTSDFVSATGYFQNGVMGHYALVRSSGQFLMYKNGSLFSSSGSLSARNMTNSYTFDIGTYSSSGWMNGVFDEFAIYNRALSASQISAAYNGGSGLPYSSFTT